LLVFVFALLAMSSRRGDRSDSRAAAGPATQPASPDRVRELMTQRRDLLRQIVQSSEIRFQKGQGSAEELAEDVVAAFRAELDLAASQGERIRLHEQIVEKMRELESRAEKMWQNGRIVETAAMRARARRMEAEIALEQARLAVATGN
jgi:hypothetical protein